MTSLDKEKILSQANELLENAEKSLKDVDGSLDEEVYKEGGSFDKENEYKNDKSLEMQEKLKNDNEKDDRQPFNLPKKGYHRVTHFRKPTVIEFVIIILAIIGLCYVISLLLPYIPPKV